MAKHFGLITRDLNALWRLPVRRNPDGHIEMVGRSGTKLDQLAWIEPRSDGKYGDGWLLHWLNWPTTHRYARFQYWKFLLRDGHWSPFHVEPQHTDKIVVLPSPTDISHVEADDLKRIGMAGYMQMQQMVERWKELSKGRTRK